jgi:hypothetical protein
MVDAFFHVGNEHDLDLMVGCAVWNTKQVLVQAGFNHYKSGTWQEARAMLEETYSMRRDPEGNIVRDTPSKVLMDFMAQTQFCAPGDWSGHRELKEK